MEIRVSLRELTNLRECVRTLKKRYLRMYTENDIRISRADQNEANCPNSRL